MNTRFQKNADAVHIYDLIRVIVMRLGAEGEHSEDDAIRLLSSMFSPTRTAEDKKKILSEEFHISVTEEINREVRRMCNLSAGILEKGIAWYRKRHFGNTLCISKARDYFQFSGRQAGVYGTK